MGSKEPQPAPTRQFAESENVVRPTSPPPPKRRCLQKEAAAFSNAVGMVYNGKPSEEWYSLYCQTVLSNDNLLAENERLRNAVAMLYSRGDLPGEGLLSSGEIKLRDFAMKIWKEMGLQ